MRFYGTLDLYDRSITNFILTVPMNTPVGVDARGKRQSRGVELALGLSANFLLVQLPTAVDKNVNKATCLAKYFA